MHYKIITFPISYQFNFRFLKLLVYDRIYLDN